ncbi:hypothetical protein HG531_013761 [Fusarium graminearum]|nr:hypothetical protein HG531_013761 [Fusarium graminearum]
MLSVFSSTLVSLKHVHYLFPGHDISLRDEELGLLFHELFVEHLEQVTGHLLADDHLDVVLLSGPEMLDELSFTSRLALGETVGLGARKILDVLRVIVTDVGAETTLVGGLTGAVLSEIDTVGVLATLVGAVLPLLEDLKGLLIVLENDETSVEVDLVKLVHVVLVGGVVGKGQRVGVGVELPVVHEPLKRKIDVVEDGIGVKENAGLVLLEDLGQNRGLLPRVAAVLKGVGDVNVVDTKRQTVSLVSAVPAHQTLREDLAGLVERTVVEIDNAEVLADHAGPLGLARELHGESTERSVLLIGRLDAGLHDVVEVVVAKLGGSIGGVVGLGHGAVWLSRLSLFRLVVMRLIMGIANDGSLGIGSAAS